MPMANVVACCCCCCCCLADAGSGESALEWIILEDGSVVVVEYDSSLARNEQAVSSNCVLSSLVVDSFLKPFLSSPSVIFWQFNFADSLLESHSIFSSVKKYLP
uniref:Putative secreted protein n=1 Tax=Panstrongylus lignarius TaxID=156445 RepID=A0A224XQK3_9HEMI